MKTSKQLFVLGLMLACIGCKKTEEERPPKPRPVEVATLSLALPPQSARVSAVVASWKTEDIGMEVGGRIKFVVEPNTDIDIEVINEAGNVENPRTKIAEIDKERFQLQLDSAKADVERAAQAIKAAEIEIDMIIPQRQAAAKAERNRARIELKRSKLLVEQEAGSEADVTRDEAAYKNADAQVKQIEAEESAKLAELTSLQKDKLKAEQAVRDATRSVEDCELYADFPGQISEVHVVPGSVVTAGQPVATLQMMDPIKIELEVSAEDSRRLRNRQRVPVWVTREDGAIEEKDGFLYLVDPVADSQTRTFTISLLVLNERLSARNERPEISATTNQTWRLDLNFLPGVDQGALYAPEGAIHTDDSGNNFVWRVTNLTIRESLPKDGRLKVEKMSVTTKPIAIPFLGNWTFRKIEIDDSTFVPSRDLIAGKLTFQNDVEADDWEGDEIFVEKSQGQWMLRPGDLVQVDLTDDVQESGLYVPMESVARSDGKSFLFVVDGNDEQTSVRRIAVDVVDGDGAKVSSMVQIRGSDDLTGKQYVTKGTHYLRDGEPVRVVSPESN